MACIQCARRAPGRRYGISPDGTSSLIICGFRADRRGADNADPALVVGWFRDRGLWCGQRRAARLRTERAQGIRGEENR